MQCMTFNTLSLHQTDRCTHSTQSRQFRGRIHFQSLDWYWQTK